MHTSSNYNFLCTFGSSRRQSCNQDLISGGYDQDAKGSVGAVNIYYRNKFY